MVRLVEIIALGTVAVLAGVGGFKIRELLGGLTNPLENVELPSLPNISLPDISLPEINVNLPDLGNAVQNAQETTQNIVSDEFTNVPEEDRTPFDALGAGLGGAFAGIGSFFGNLVNQQSEPVQNLTPTPEERSIGNQSILQSLGVSSEINQSFEGGGPSFQGGIVRETPLNSLSDVIDRFGVGATEANDILARIRNDFDDFNFGTNTGCGS